MVRLRFVLRDLALVCVAVVIGWWLRGAGTTVLARGESSSTTEGNLAFQLTGVAPETALTLYNPANHTLYVYPHIGQANSHISCSYSFSIPTPGAAIERSNCPMGELLPQH
jgi:hypothetical protein